MGGALVLGRDRANVRVVVRDSSHSGVRSSRSTPMTSGAYDEAQDSATRSCIHCGRSHGVCGGSWSGRRILLTALGVFPLELAYCRDNGALQASDQGARMADKSPRQQMSKKSGKSIKEKRADKRAKAEAKSNSDIVPPRNRR